MESLTIAGQTSERGAGIQANSTHRLLLNRGRERFTASVGVDDAAGDANQRNFKSTIKAFLCEAPWTTQHTERSRTPMNMGLTGRRTNL